MVAVLGMGGIGKTSLAARLAQQVAPSFERVYWRSLRNAPPASEWLAGAIGFLSDQQLVPPPSESERIMALLADKQLIGDTQAWLSLVDRYGGNGLALKTVFPDELYQAPRTWVEQVYPNLVYFNEVDKGGHFAAWEKPELFSAELRAAFRSLR